MNDQLVSQGNSNKPARIQSDALQARQAQEVQASMAIAKRFPRDENDARSRIKRACSRIGLAQEAQYVFPRGGTRVKGPSIRLAEVLAQSWGNLDFGIKEIEQNVGNDGIPESIVQAYCWDMETNTRETKEFTVKHIRDTKKGQKILDTQRDIYEMVANMGARRLRSCILAIIPKDIQDEAVEQCEKTLKGRSDTPIEDRIYKMLDKFNKYGVNKEMIKNYVGHNIDAIDENELTDLISVYTSLKDGMKDREFYFDINVSKKDTSESNSGNDITNEVTGKKDDSDDSKKVDEESSEETGEVYKPKKKEREKALDRAQYLSKKQQNSFVKFVNKTDFTKSEWGKWSEKLKKAEKKALKEENKAKKK